MTVVATVTGNFPCAHIALNFTAFTSMILDKKEGNEFKKKI
jgi:hypothetical protein